MTGGPNEYPEQDPGPLRRASGTSCCVPAGGERQPWSAKVTFSGATDPAVTIVASTGGHLQRVERFAITGARPGSTN
ncbi:MULTISPECIES: hypothetical protein [unclassified Kribbella]|uniref:hypothetical protein n=1 Tax=unclassified Kribbella TaxID=2644121 RepID=UPI00301859D7